MSNAASPADVLGLVGTTIDQVRFDACVDAGGFGLIYRGYHEGLGETVAIKCLRIASMQRTDEAIREALAGRFRDETKLLYRLSQGNLDIVRCIGSGTVIAPATKEYTPYMVLEWLDGCTLSVELKERRAQGLRPRTLDEAVGLLDSAAGGLAYAHTNDVVHRDVKPGNLFLTRTREGVRLKVLDFGLAKILDNEAIGVRPSVETGIGVHFCSPSYGAPEQYSSAIGKIGPWTDVYSLTLVLLEILTGDKVRPAGSLAEGLLKAIDPKSGSPSASSLGLRLPPAVEALLLRGVAQQPLDRPHDVGVYWAALKEAIASSPKPNPNAMTVMDDSVGQAMQQVRAAEAAARGPGPAPAAAPFTGTMLMQNAPAGAPHLVQALVPAAGRPPDAPAGRAPDAGTAGGTQPTAAPLGVSRTTAPLQPPSHDAKLPSIPPAPGPDSVVAAKQRGEALLKGTLPIGAVSPLSGMSPLAASMAMPSPLRGMGSGPPPPMGVPQGSPAYSAPLAPSQQPQQQQHPRPHQPRTDPRMGAVAAAPAKSASAGIVVVVLFLVVAVVGATFYWVRIRGH